MMRKDKYMILLGILVALGVGIALFWTVGIAAALIAAFFTAISVTVIKLFILPKFEARDKYRLETDNVRLRPEKLEVRFDTLKNGYVIDCIYNSPETGRKFVFTTKPYAQDPTPYLAEAKIAIVTNRIDYSNYYIDIQGLESLPYNGE